MNIKAGFWDNLSADQKDEIEESIHELEMGETVDYEDFIKKHKE